MYNKRLILALSIIIILIFASKGLTQITFTDITDLAGVGVSDTSKSEGVAFCDYDNDGHLDLFVTNYQGSNILYHNNGDGTYTDVTYLAGLETTGSSVAFGDYDNNGDLDIYMRGILYRHNGDGTFTNVTAQAGLIYGGMTVFGDYDQDGNVDIYVLRGVANVLYHNNGNGTFSDVTITAGVGDIRDAEGTVSFDYDNDGDLDIYITNGGGGDWTNILYQNNGNGTFTDITIQADVGDTTVGRGPVCGDINNDGYLDLYVGNLSGDILFFNNGDGTFSDVTESAGISNYANCHTPILGDFDNDGYLDLYLVNNDAPNVFYRNNGNGTFTDITSSAGIGNNVEGTGGTIGDYDNDGDLDIYVANRGQKNVLYRNNGNTNNWLIIKTIGTAINKDGIGTRVRVVSGSSSQIREVSGGSGYGSQNSLFSHFGLGTNTNIDSIIVRWPTQREQVLTNVGVNQILTIQGPSAKTIYVDSSNTSGTEDGTLERPYNTISEGIDAVISGDTVIVANGTYFETVNFSGKAILLVTQSVPDLTIIDAQRNGEAVIFESGEGLNSIIEGFTIRNGYASRGAGIYCSGSSPIIRNNKIISNEATGNGGGILCFNGSSPIIEFNEIKGNLTDWDGGGISCNTNSSPSIRNNTIYENYAYNGGGGIFCWDHCSTQIYNNLIFDNYARGEGGGVSILNQTSSIIENNTVAYNHTKSGNGGIFIWETATAEIRNTISYFNEGNQINVGPNSSAKVSYCDIENGWVGTGNIAQSPVFANPGNIEYHLQLGSPCIDVGNPDPAYNDVDGSRNDMGAYGGPGGESYTYEDGPPVVEKVQVIPNVPLSGEDITISAYVWDEISSVNSVQAEIESPDEKVIVMIDLYDDGLHEDGAAGDSIYGNIWMTLPDTGCTYLLDVITYDADMNAANYNNMAKFITHIPRMIYVDSSNTSGNEVGTLEQPFNTISEGIDAALAGDTVLVLSGKYKERVNLKTDVVLMGQQPNNTIIFGNVFAVDVIGAKIFRFTVTDRNTAAFHLYNSEVTITNCIAYNQPHNCVHCDDNTSVTAINNTFVNNGHGCGLFNNSSAYFRNNIIANNKEKGIFTDGSSTTICDYNNWWGNDRNFGGNASAGDNDIFENPLFLDANNNYHLQLGSPSIDTGDLNQIYNDLDGSRNDMGAYGGPWGDTYEYIDNSPPFIENVYANPGYVEPGNSVLIKTTVLDAGSGVSTVHSQIVDENQSFMAMIELFDDGNHYDDFADDNVFANFWNTVTAPNTYFVNILSTDNVALSDTLKKATIFTTNRSALPLNMTINDAEDKNPALLQAQNGKIWLFWNSERSGHVQIWCKNSSDGGLTWSNDQLVSPQESCDFPSVAQSSDGKIWIFWHGDEQEIWYIISTDNGNSWSSAQRFTTDPSNDEFPCVATDENDKMVVVWNSWRTGNFDIFCKVSLDNGNTWTNPTQITTDRALDEDPSVTIDNNGNIHVVWFWAHDYIQYSKSSDNGQTWSEPIFITSEEDGICQHPAINVDSSGKLWVIYNHSVSWQTRYKTDLYYITSTDGIDWTTPGQITHFVGFDGFPDIKTIINQQWSVWYSNRTVNYDIWLSKLGATYDINPPPTAYWVTHQPFSPAPTADDNISIQARVADESGPANVQLIYSIDDQAQSNLEMYDDGNHHDEAPNDNIYAIEIGQFPAETIFEYQVEVQDIAGNTVLIPQNPNQGKVVGPFSKTSNILLIADYQEDYSDWLLPYYTDALENNGFNYDVWDCFVRGGVDQENLNLYLDGVVVWFTPFGGSYLTDQTIQENIQNYLESGGKLFITGQDIGSTIGDTDLYRDYLHAQFIQELEEAYIVKGTNEDPISNGLNLVIIEGEGANNQEKVDEIDPISPAVSIFNYEHSNLSSTGTAALSVDVNTYMLVYFAFGFEAINKVEDRDFLMFSVLKWLVPSIHEAGISYVTPDEGYNQGSVTVTIHGFGFAPEATVQLRKSGYQDIIGTKTTVVDSNKIISTFNLMGSALGKWDVMVTNLYGQELTLPEGFTIDEGYVNLWATIVGREQVRQGREQFFNILYGNSGNIDTSDVVMLVTLPLGVEYTLSLERPVIGDLDWSMIPFGFEADTTAYLPIWLPSVKAGSVKQVGLLVKVPSFHPSVHKNLNIQKTMQLSVVKIVLRHKIAALRAQEDKYKDIYEEVLSKKAEGASREEFHEWFENAYRPTFLETLVPYHLNEIQADVSDINTDVLTSLAKLSPWIGPILVTKDFVDIAMLAKEATRLQNEVDKWDAAYESFSRKFPVVNSLDPNEKAGMAGFGRNNSLPTIETFRYIVYFENVDSATAAAQEIVIFDTLDNNLDWNNCYFIDIQLGNRSFKMPDSSQQFYKTIHLNDTTDVEIEVTLNQNTGIIKWHLKGIDLVYGGWGDILPPNKIPPEGEGYVIFSIKPKQNLISSTKFKNRASIIFDLNPPILTNEVFNTIDACPPNSYVHSALQLGDSLNYEISWLGIDDSLGSGVKNFDIFYSDNGGPYTRWLTNVTDTSAFFTAENGHLYRFYSISRDSTGNIESQPDSFDLKLNIPEDVPINIDDSRKLPTEFSLSQNYPNPFNPQTKILYQLPVDSKVLLEIYNILGQQVRTLINKRQKAGYYQIVWDGHSDSGLEVTSGLYLYRFKANDYISVKKALILR